MNIEIEELKPCQKKLRVVIPDEKVRDETGKSYRRLRQSVKINGFRKGKIPRHILEQRYSERVRSDVIKRLIPDALTQAIEESGIRPAGRPTIEEMNVDEGQPLSFSAIMDVLPDFELKEYKDIELTREIVPVNDGDIEEILNNLRESWAVLEEVDTDSSGGDGKSVEDGDYVRFEIDGSIEGNVLYEGKRTTHSLVVGKREAFPEIETALPGMKTGESKEITIHFPPDYTEKTIAGKKGVYNLTVKEVRIRRVPELNDEFAGSVASGKDIKTLRENIKKDLEKRRFEEADAKLKESLMDRLILDNSFDIPESLVENEMNRMGEQLRRRLAMEGIKKENMQLSGEQQEELRERAARSVRGELIIEKSAEREDIQITDRDLDVEVRKIAERQKTDADVLRRRLEEQKSLESLRRSLLVDRTYDALFRMIKITDTFSHRSQP